MKRRIATLAALALVATPSIASADPPPHVLRHADAPLAATLPALGTDVAAPDQQASRPAPAPQAGADGFDWGDAGIGAIAGSALAAFAIAGAAGLRGRPAGRLAA